MKKEVLIEIVGWTGGILILLSYALLNLEKIGAETISYQSMNFVGSLGLCYTAYKKSAKQPLIVNIIWAIIAIVAIGRLLI